MKRPFMVIHNVERETGQKRILRKRSALWHLVCHANRICHEFSQCDQWHSRGSVDTPVAIRWLRMDCIARTGESETENGSFATLKVFVGASAQWWSSNRWRCLAMSPDGTACCSHGREPVDLKIELPIVPKGRQESPSTGKCRPFGTQRIFIGPIPRARARG